LPLNAAYFSTLKCITPARADGGPLPPSKEGNHTGSTSLAGSGDAGDWKLRSVLSLSSNWVLYGVFPPSAPQLPRYAHQCKFAVLTQKISRSAIAMARVFMTGPTLFLRKVEEKVKEFVDSHDSPYEGVIKGFEKPAVGLLTGSKVETIEVYTVENPDKNQLSDAFASAFTNVVAYHNMKSERKLTDVIVVQG